MATPRWLPVFVLLTLAGLYGGADARAQSLTPDDIAAVRAAAAAYEAAWLSNDPERVMETLTDDAVIVPSGLPALAGKDAIRGFWWPAGAAPTVVTEFTAAQDEVGGHGDVAFVRGTFTLRFTYDAADYANGGTYLTLLRRQPTGAWRISHRTWSDRPRSEN